MNQRAYRETEEQIRKNELNHDSFILTGNRIPRDYFVSSGSGESDITIHAGSYHLALKNAGIEMCNIITYSSILPGIAREVERPAGLVHGSVMESIMAVSTAEKGHRATAGIIYGWLHDRERGARYGGLVCEHNGDYSDAEIRENLTLSIQELYCNGYSADYSLTGMNIITKSFIPEKKYGTALVSLCFVNYVYPVISGMAG